MTTTKTPRCGEHNHHGGTRCRVPVRDGGPCRHHGDTAALRAEVTAWVEWVAHSNGLGTSDAEGCVGSLVGVHGDLDDWTPEEMRRALDGLVASLGMAR